MMADTGGMDHADIDLHLQDMFRSKCGDTERMRSTLQQMQRSPHKFVVPSQDAEKVQILEYTLGRAISMGIPYEIVYCKCTSAWTTNMDYTEMSVILQNQTDLCIDLMMYAMGDNMSRIMSDAELTRSDSVNRDILLGSSVQLRMRLNLRLGLERRFTLSLLRFYIRYIKNGITLNLNKQIYLNPDRDNLRRSCLVMELLYLALNPYPARSSSHLKNNLDIIWRQLPDTYITTMDIRKYCFGNYEDPEQEFIFDFICERAKEIAPNDLDFPPTPRSLAQYCRCIVRRRLEQNKQLPLGIYSLGISKKCQDYLRLI